MKRIFAAVKIYPSEQLLHVFDQLKLELKRDKIKWVKPGNIHITLKFFGETDELEIPGIIDSLESVAKEKNPFEIEMKNVGIFGSPYNPRVIWFGLENAKPLINLANSVLNSMDVMGFKRDRQNFVPHLTIGRIKSIDQKNHFQDVINKYKHHDIQFQKIQRFHLIESILRPTGPEYKIIQTFELK